MAKDIEKRFDNSNHELERPFPKRKNKNVISLVKNELGRKIMKEFVGWRAKAYNYLPDDKDES